MNQKLGLYFIVSLIALSASLLPAGMISAAEIDDQDVERGVEYGRKGMYDDALKELNKAIGINPKSAKAYHYRATVFAYKNNLDKAIADWNKSIELDDNQFLSHYSRGLAFYRKGDIDKAITDWNKSILLNPNYADSYFRRGSAFFNKKDYDGAIADFTKAMEVDPANARNYYFNRSVIYSVKKDYDKSWEDIHSIEKLGGMTSPEFDEFLRVLKKESGRDK
jgi:tetratricopeptide (TPR) repeat protein